MALPMAVPICIWMASIALDERGAVERGLLGHLGAAGEGDQPDFDVPGHLAQERLGRVLRGHHAAWA